MKSTREILLQRSSFELSQALRNQYRIGGIKAIKKIIDAFSAELGAHEGVWIFTQELTKADVDNFVEQADLDMAAIMAGEETYSAKDYH